MHQAYIRLNIVFNLRSVASNPEPETRATTRPQPEFRPKPAKTVKVTDHERRPRHKTIYDSSKICETHSIHN